MDGLEIKNTQGDAPKPNSHTRSAGRCAKCHAKQNETPKESSRKIIQVNRVIMSCLLWLFAVECLLVVVCCLSRRVVYCYLLFAV